jgi:hypothetical protein
MTLGLSRRLQPILWEGQAVELGHKTEPELFYPKLPYSVK